MTVKVLKGFNNCFSVYVRLRQDEEDRPLQVMHLTHDTEFPIIQHLQIHGKSAFVIWNKTGYIR